MDVSLLLSAESAGSAGFPWQVLIAGYAAGVSTLVAAYEIFLELTQLHFAVEDKGSTRRVTVVNSGRHPIVIAGIYSLERHSKQPPQELTYIEWKPPDRVGESGIRVAETAPSTTRPIYVAKDALGRWWPRRRRLRMLWMSFLTKREE